MAVQDIRICFIGDSFVNGTGDETFLGWAGRLCAAAQTDEIALTYYNLGVRRNTSSDILQRWETECSLRLPDLCDGRVVLCCGVNDMVLENGQVRVATEVSRKNVRKLLLQASAKYTTLMVGPAPVGDDDLNNRIQTISAAYAQEAAALNIPFVDVFSHLVSNQKYLLESRHNDGYHPRSDGYTAIAKVIAASPQWWFKSA